MAHDLRDASAVGRGRHGSRPSILNRVLGVATAAMLGIDAVVHARDAHFYDAVQTSVISQGTLFRLEAAVCDAGCGRAPHPPVAVVVGCRPDRRRERIRRSHALPVRRRRPARSDTEHVRADLGAARQVRVRLGGRRRRDPGRRRTPHDPRTNARVGGSQRLHRTTPQTRRAHPHANNTSNGRSNDRSRRRAGGRAGRLRQQQLLGAPRASAAPANTKVGILLPDTASSPRWVSADPNELNKQCTAYKLTCYIDNANGSATTQQSQAQALINAGVGVLLVVNLDSGSGKAIEDLAKQHNVVTIDYDRLTAGGTASYYVSYDNVKVGEDQGTALTQCPQVKGKSSVNYVEIDGAPTDNNATLFAQGYNSVLSKQPGWTKLADQTGNWDAATAQTVFTTMLGQHRDINAVMVANDTMAQSVINVLKSQGLRARSRCPGRTPAAGGLDNIMAGTQCFTIYKPVAGEADVAIKLAWQILAGQKPTAPTTINDPTNGREVPSYLADPDRHHQGQRRAAGDRRLRDRRRRLPHRRAREAVHGQRHQDLSEPTPVTTSRPRQGSRLGRAGGGSATTNPEE